MGMFDSFYTAQGHEWQTKALERSLAAYRVGDHIGGPDYQMKVLGDGKGGSYRYSYVTIRAGVVEAIDVPRTPSLALMGYRGGWEEDSEATR